MMMDMDCEEEEQFQAFGSKNAILDKRRLSNFKSEMFEKLGETMEYAETHYYKEKGNSKSLIQLN